MSSFSGATISSTLRELGLEEIKKEHGLDSREVILLLLLTQKLMIVQVTAPEPG